MSIIATWRRAVGLLAAGAVAVLLSGCVVSSATNLVSPDEVEPDVLPATFAMKTYNAGADGVFVASEEEAGVFTLKDGGYVAPDGSLTAYIVGIEDPDHYLIATAATDGTMYGTVGIGGNGIMEIRMVISEDPSAIADQLPAGATVADGGLMVTDRASLDAVIALIARGTIKTEPLIAYIGDGTPPATIVTDGDWYKAGS